MTDLTTALNKGTRQLLDAREKQTVLERKLDKALAGWNTLEERINLVREYLEADAQIEDAKQQLQACRNAYDTFGEDVKV